MELKLERIYTKPADLDGYRILVDRIWPRGISKADAHLNKWLKEVGPSNDLRKWYGHDVARYPEFKERYLAELAASPAYYNSLKAIVQDQLQSQNVIILYGAKDEKHNQAVILVEKLIRDLKLNGK
ncbi:DUF488 family protein [Lactobacillus sp. 0.1XD8-4]|uniref:DUF488 family protein n=1 Tax=Limosilactobacillus walteri TaxID=2268022 RepID=A0ABR8P3F9_9LACO|nr:DUF488 family protein [Limosilactobacillus walteri]MBD5805544.1 DUF488 family protein [Limosilactobacillus walteri]MRN07043.1 DUF488 family protein [Lactobacillus sp. 0.1XD8-4]